ncbi:hypothetical protein O1611_g7512 [Lasiodiplodia mahajangana]|uniref:Uncharacterized protein n=1 Tax=Lasiodiplodia mahajangana TaxID=1108764 RepID=A0ACC2JF52_9PEZI|nr:hypothetical protein O1611_g7512 [Lasiodiplodia mahajangana]
MSLPSDFQWGFATAAFQIEGASEADGRGPTIWDKFCAIEGKIADKSDGSVACDSPTAFPLSWARIVPLGGRNDPINQKGIDHYVKFVDDLLEAGITPFITLLHWDVPDGIEQRYGGLLNRQEFPLDFEHYARVVFKAIPKVQELDYLQRTVLQLYSRLQYRPLRAGPHFRPD